jgi:hypothetical protein
VFGLILLVLGAPLLAVLVLRVLTLRAIPLCLGGVTVWLTGIASGNWAVAGIAGLAIAALSALLLERLSTSDATRGGVVMIEAAAGLMLVTLFMFAVFYSSGVRGAPLALALASSAIFSLVISFSYRRS